MLQAPSSTVPLKNDTRYLLPTAVGNGARCGKLLTSLRTPSTRTPRPTSAGNGRGLAKAGNYDLLNTLPNSFMIVVVNGFLVETMVFALMMALATSCGRDG